MRRDDKALESSTTDLQCRSMKNLIFTDIVGKTTEDRLRAFLYYELGINDHIQFRNVHRFHRYVGGQDRPTVARIIYQKDLVTVRNRTQRLSNTCHGIIEQYPASIKSHRREL